MAWRQQAEFVTKYFHKGNAICIVGSLQTRNYVDQQGNKRYVTEVVADEISFVEKKSDAPGAHQYEPTGETAPAFSNDAANAAPNFEEVADDDDLPF